MCTDGHPDFAILISSNATDLSRTSKLYFEGPGLDFQINKAQDLLILKNMRCLNYLSSLEKYSERDLLRHVDPEGRPDMLAWRKTDDLHISSVDYEGRDLSLNHSAIGHRTRLMMRGLIYSCRSRNGKGP